MNRGGQMTLRLGDVREEIDALAASIPCNKSNLIRAALRSFGDLSADKQRHYLKQTWAAKGRPNGNGKK